MADEDTAAPAQRAAAVREEEEEGEINISENDRTALTLKVAEYGFTARGGTVTFVIEARESYRTEVFYSWVKFPSAEAQSHTFHSYTEDETPHEYCPYEDFEVLLTYQEHINWFKGALPHTKDKVRLGQLGREGATWPVFAAYTPHPEIDTMPVADLRPLHKEVIQLYRTLTQFVMRTLTLQPARATQAGPIQGNATKITPQTLNAVMGRMSTKCEIMPFWIAQKETQLEAVFPHTSPQEKHRMLTICLPMGIAPQIEDCTTWGLVFAAIYTRVHSIAFTSSNTRHIKTNTE